MVLVLTFGVVLFVTVALSQLAARSVLSTAQVFLLAGVLVGPGALGLIEVSPQGGIVSTLADLALFTVQFVDGGRLPLRQLRTGWRLSGRALGLGIPVTLVLIAVATHFLVGLDRPTSLLVVQTGIPPAQTVFELVALTIALSMVVHSMSDVPVARAFRVEEIAGVPAQPKAAR